MAAIAPRRPEVAVRPGLDGFVDFCELVEFPLQRYMKRIARAHFDRSRETVAVLPRGNFKTTIAALIGLHHLLSTRGASVVVGAASRDRRASASSGSCRSWAERSRAS
jgi:hypothetical protein